MLQSILLMLVLGLLSIPLTKKLSMPALIAYLIVGIIVGPHALKLISPQVIAMGPDIKKIALIIILIRAGLSLNMDDLRHTGISAGLMCVLPATVEILASLIFGPIFLGMTLMQSLMLGTVIAAVSPAVVVPRMVDMIDHQKGTRQGVPQLILAGASADDIYVLVLFSALLTMQASGHIDIGSLLAVPISIALGWLFGKGVGIILSKRVVPMSWSVTLKCLWILAADIGLMLLDTWGQPWFSGLVATIVMTMKIAKDHPTTTPRLKDQFNQYWVLAEMFLFMFVGMDTNIATALDFGWMPLVFIFVTSLFRMGGVYLALYPSNLTSSEKLFTMGAYLPKATVQAAIGSIPLTLGFPQGALILSVSVLEILVTAPLGSLWIDLTQDKLLQR